MTEARFVNPSRNGVYHKRPRHGSRLELGYIFNFRRGYGVYFFFFIISAQCMMNNTDIVLKEEN